MAKQMRDRSEKRKKEERRSDKRKSLKTEYPSAQMRDQTLHSVVSRSRFESQKAKTTSRSEQVRQPGHLKGAFRCCVKCTWKQACSKHLMVGALLEVAMLKKARRYGTSHARTALGG